MTLPYPSPCPPAPTIDWLLLAVALVGFAVGIALWWVRRRGGRLNARRAPPEVGYGRARWERELALWEGTLRRLQIQAARHDTMPPHIAREIEHARGRIERARSALDQHQ